MKCSRYECGSFRNKPQPFEWNVMYREIENIYVNHHRKIPGNEVLFFLDEINKSRTSQLKST